MTISEAIEDYHGDTRLKVGSEDGNGYFYCGTVSDFLTKLDYYSDALRDHLINRYAKAKNSSQTMITLFCSDVYKAITTTSFTDTYISNLKPIFGRIAKIVTTETNIKELLDKFVPLKERSVINIFRSDPTIDFNCLVLVINGYENGKYWDTNEAGTDHIGFNVKAEDVSNNFAEEDPDG